MKNQPFELTYIDLFAGTGVSTTKNDPENPLSGSASIALDVKDRQFDKFIFVEKDPKKFTELNTLRNSHPKRDIEVLQQDANNVMSTLQFHEYSRGVIFLDPFAPEVKYTTVEEIANLECLDMWVLFPTNAVSRMLSKDYEQVTSEKKLIALYGTKDWKTLYDQKHKSLDSKSTSFRLSGYTNLINVYKKRLKDLFQERFLEESLPL